MSIILSADKIRDYNKAFDSLLDKQILPYVPDAEEKFIKRYLGKTLFAALDAYVAAGQTPTDTEYDLLLPYVERALSRFTLYMASPALDINTGATGFTVANTGTAVPASKERVAKYDKSLLRLGWENVETMLKFLEENEDDYPLWINSDAYTFATNNFIHTAEEFDNYAAIEVNRLMFYHIKPEMNNTEIFDINTVISEDLADEIKQQIIDDDVSTENEAILKYIKPAVVNLTIAKVTLGTAEDKDTSFTLQLKDDQRKSMENLGNHYIMEVQKILDAVPDDYPLYKASDLYNEDKTSNDLFEVDEDDIVIGFGAIPV